MTNLQSVPGYRTLTAARVLSSTILWVDFTLVFSLLGYYWHADAATIGVASALYGLPGLVLGPFFGALADRVNPVAMLAVSYLARALTSLLLLFAPDTHFFVLLVFLKGLANLGAMPAEQVIVRTMLSKAQLVSNASIMTTIDQLTKICAPLVGAGMASLHHPMAGFGLSATLGLAGILCVYPLRKHVGMSKREAGTQARRHLHALFLLVRDNAVFRRAFGAAVSQTAILGLYDPLLALFLKEKGMPAGTFGMIVSSTAAGAILGALIFKRVHAGSRHCTATVGLAGFGLTVAIPGLLALANIGMPVWLLLAFWVANGCFYGLTAMSFVVAMQQQCQLESIGTVSATARSVQLAVLVLGPLAGAALANLLGISLVFVLSGTIAIVIGGVLGRPPRTGMQPHLLKSPVERKGP
ncbi:MFS transporter [Cupriavidus sp. CP313]